MGVNWVNPWVGLGWIWLGPVLPRHDILVWYMLYGLVAVRPSVRLYVTNGYCTKNG